MPQPTNTEKDEEYNRGLVVLVENKKLGLLTQDQYDQQHRELVKRVYGEVKEQ
jgi:hypothetical protein